MKKLPNIGEYYHFFDDGKRSPSRHYICRIERIVPISEAKDIIVNKIPHYDYNDNIFYSDETLLQLWIMEKSISDHLFADYTDFFIEASCPEYDDYNLWFVRTRDGGWFSINIQSSWQSGRLDIDNGIYEKLKETYNDTLYESGTVFEDLYPEANEEHWKKRFIK